MSSIHYEAKRPSGCLAAMSFSTSALLPCEGADQTRRRAGGLLFVIRGEVGAALALIQVGKNAFMPFCCFSVYELCPSYIMLMPSCSMNTDAPFRVICNELPVKLIELEPMFETVAVLFTSSD